ncbi:UNVERIFIED_CONTAM: BEL1-like homeodomain protein 2 [Sesamum radiatum]|uniref:BEL1-like homeodomain protein 2 n=1 Tax=Sesamum radiatum TaxID=300843 RepID=A0AAW2P3K7_SESRA
MDMGIATPTLLPSVTSHSKGHNSLQYLDKPNFPNSMSQDYHQSIFSFSNGFERSQQEQQQQHIAQQIRRDKLRVQGFQPPVPPLVGIEGEESGELPVYETAGMLSEMFNFPSGVAATATELLENQILQSYRNPRATPPSGGASTADWFPHRQGMVVGGTNLGDSKNQTVVNDTASHHHHQQQQHQISSINADSAAAMQLFLMNPQQQRSPSPSPSHPPPSTSSTLHMLLPNPSSSTTLQAFQNPSAGAFGQFTWVPNSGNENNPNEIPGVVEGQGLSLSLSSSLQHLEAAKAEELRMGEGGMLFFGQGGGSTPPQYQFKNLVAAAESFAFAGWSS